MGVFFLGWRRLWSYVFKKNMGEQYLLLFYPFWLTLSLRTDSGNNNNRNDRAELQAHFAFYFKAAHE